MNNPIIVIGTGMAGYSLAREFRKLNPDTPMVIIANDSAASYAKPTLSNALSLGKTPDQIALADQSKMEAQLNCKILSNCKVDAIDTKTDEIHYTLQGSTEQHVLVYAKLILALGASAIVPNLPASAPVHTVNHLDDYKQFVELLSNNDCKHVTIIGAGLIGCEFADDLVKQQYAVSIVDIAPYPLSRLLPAEVGSEFSRQLASAGIVFKGNSSITDIKANASGFAVIFNDGEQLQTDIVLSAIGLKPNTTIAAKAGITVNRGILTNRLLQTNVSNIYAIGDCAEVEGLILPYVMPLLAQARALAQTLNDNATPVNYPAMPVVVKTPSAPLVVCPVLNNAPVQWTISAEAGEISALATGDDGKLQGFALLGPMVGKQRMTLAKQIPDWLV